jgi:hypothetical protein
VEKLLQQLEPYFLIILVVAMNVVFIGVAALVSTQQRQATVRAWDDFAIRNGLTINKGSFFITPSLSGDYRQRPVRVYLFSRGSSRSRTVYTGIDMTVSNTTGSTLGLSPSSAVGDFFGKLFSTQDVQTGNLEFDARFTVKSQPPDFAIAAFDDSMVRMGLMEIDGYFHISLQGSSMVYTERGRMRDTTRMEKLFNTLSDLADRVEGKKKGSF